MNDGIEYKNATDKSVGYDIVEGEKSVEKIIPFTDLRGRKKKLDLIPHQYAKTPQWNDGVVWVFDNPNVDVYMTFEVKVNASHLKPIHYSPYQYELWNICKALRDEGNTLPFIANWLNSNGYKTVRGKKFRNPHVHSILKKKRIADERMKKREIPKIKNMNLKIFMPPIKKTCFPFLLED